MSHESIDSPVLRGRNLPGPGIVLGLTLLVVSTVTGCGRPGEAADVQPEAGESEIILAHAHASPSALGRAVLRALESQDQEALRALRVTREEWLELFWAELPESDSTPFDFAWQLKDDNSRAAERAALEEFGGEDFELIDLKFTDPPEVYDTFTLHFGAELWARRVSDGREGLLPVLDVVVERGGLWKLSNLVD